MVSVPLYEVSEHFRCSQGLFRVSEALQDMPERYKQVHGDLRGVLGGLMGFYTTY